MATAMDIENLSEVEATSAAPSRIFVEIVGLIGAGKTTLLTKYRENLPHFYPRSKVVIDLEDEETLTKMITPLLTIIYKQSPTEEDRCELQIEAIFASIRLIGLYAATHTITTDSIQRYVGELCQRLELPFLFEEATIGDYEEIHSKLLSVAQEKVFLPLPGSNAVVCDRGVTDVLIFFIERMEAYSEDSSIRAIFLKLFDQVMAEICRLIYGWTGETAPTVDLYEKLSDSPSILYSVYMMDTDPWRCEGRIEKRARSSEVDQTCGIVLDRVLKVNQRLHELYGEEVRTRLMGEDAGITSLLYACGLLNTDGVWNYEKPRFHWKILRNLYRRAHQIYDMESE